MATHLITGGSGFLGFEIARALHARGEKVRLLDVVEPPYLPEGVVFIQADILNFSRVLEAMRGVEVVHHNAALVPVTKAGPRYWQVHVDGTQNVLAAAKGAGVSFFIYMSSSAVFGVPGSCPIHESTPLRPVEEYGRSKLAGERMVEKFSGNGCPCAIVRPRTIIGPGRLGIFQILYQWIREGRRIYVIGEGNNLFQFVHVRDVVDFVLLLAEKRKRGTFNIGAPRFATIREDLTSLIRHAGTSARVVGTPAAMTAGILRILDALRLSPLAPYHYLVYSKPFYFDISRALSDVGWKPRYGNVDALIESYDWFLNQSETTREGSTHRRPARAGILGLLKRLS